MSVVCKSCGARVPAVAKNCEGCGAVMAAKPRLVPLAAFMLIVILILQAYMSKTDNPENEAATAAPVSSSEQ